MVYSRLATPSATIAALDDYGLRTKKSLGQHFLVDDNVVGRILDLAGIAAGEPIVEVGPGIGTLTDALLGAGALVTAVEYDTRLLPVLAHLAEERSGLTVVHADAVSVTAGELAASGEHPRALVANLPYGIAATVVLRFFEMLPSLERAIVMVQAEVAGRMAAVPGTKEYGAYTVKLRLHARPTGRFAVSRACFLPPPRVDSAVIRLDRDRGDLPGHVRTAAARAADAAFSQRRKTLRNSLSAGLGVSVDTVSRILATAGLDGSLRAESLDVDDYLALGNALVEHAGAIEV
ncbi:MAG: 16S rRNA (adenine(1518)-N(6)/adenine(1519)-N(6))-dimethyltransferase RsmA [Aeromicrobium sp.]|jgi:16S rRNA (adenine1518-N6/adenine1519-N6)-dimethyltransferase|nr:16S rRNA (adenine(1518)-N(6)/adenine(1519)-N(6))-dimethyltransferase RsmA [Aeromicrobium sp.]